MDFLPSPKRKITTTLNKKPLKSDFELPFACRESGGAEGETCNPPFTQVQSMR
jgi:hypothetical protein